ncbi:hypothetical protein PsAD5_02160 [Pseudovibrio sp. Ad5]|uniref:hypothetical protein n=1 Tax=Pseudovibrio sp. Ad5 TaxID=989436 RepID=UPI0007AEB2E9|nr:hypothetical protein [Pseudovibrio sp. Ad5]KZK97921.1 hypothetical protein PsAD5_02160 [Pseudovibrio sp. Ad5]
MIDFKKDFSVTSALVLLVPLLALSAITIAGVIVIIGVLANFAETMFTTGHRSSATVVGLLTMAGTIAMPIVTVRSFYLVRKQLSHQSDANEIQLLPFVREAHSLVAQDLKNLQSLLEADSLLSAINVERKISKSQQPMGGSEATNFAIYEAIRSLANSEAKVMDYISDEVSNQRNEITFIINYVKQQILINEKAAANDPKYMSKKYNQRIAELIGVFNNHSTTKGFKGDIAANASQNDLMFAVKLVKYYESLQALKTKYAIKLNAFQSLLS